MASPRLARLPARLGFAVGAVFLLSRTVAAQTDSIKAPIGITSALRLPEIGPEYRWKGNEIFATGAITLADLLERVPGIRILRSGGLLSPQIPRLMGDAGGVRIFLDGVELDNMDGRSESLDLAWIPLWSLEEVSIDRSAGEIRVNLRTITAASTTPLTRTDVYTGDEDTNIYRGFYGKRFERGQALQFGAEQANSKSARGGSGDKFSAISRLGMANRRWSLDAFANRTEGSRDLQRPFVGTIPIPEYHATNSYAYLRFVAGNASQGPWLAAILSRLAINESSPRTDSVRAAFNRIAVDTVDSARSERQLVLRSGFTQPKWRAIVEDRIRNTDAKTYHDLTGGAEIFSNLLSAGARLKGSGFGPARAEAWARFQPLSFLAFNASAARNSAAGKGSPSSSALTPDRKFLQAEAGLRLFGPWLSAGIMTQDTSLGRAPGVFAQGFTGNASGKGTASYVTLRGTFHRAFILDAYAMKWDEDALYRPRTQSRTELRFRTKWLSRFPKGEFELNSSVTHYYNSRTFFRTQTTASSLDAAQHVDLLIEIRILRGVATYQLRNLTGYAYENLPGFYAQRAFNLYGVRWEFWN